MATECLPLSATGSRSALPTADSRRRSYGPTAAAARTVAARSGGKAGARHAPSAAAQAVEVVGLREPRDRETGLDVADVEHYSWREVYAACDVDTGGHEERNGGDRVV